MGTAKETIIAALDVRAWKRIAGFAGRLIPVLLGCTLVAMLLLAQRTWPLELFTVGGMVLVTLVAYWLTRFHLRHTPLKTSVPIAERIIWLTAVLAISGVQLLWRSIGPQGPLDQGFLLMAPLVAQAMLLSALLGPSISLFALTVVMLTIGVSRSMPVEMLAASWLAGAVGSHAVNPLRNRSDLLRAVTIQVFAQALIALCISAVNTSKYTVVLESAGWAAVAAVMATSIFWLAVTVLERIFGIISDWSLLELSSPDHPLIRELCLKAPGTYAHSVLVGNLCEDAARAIGANPVLCRTMAYFHDVGKAKRPPYFVENQQGANLHDELSPTLSAMVIAAHVRDGVEMAKKHHLPEIVIDGIREHHGTSLISYFYSQAVQQNPGQPDGVLEQFFRYDGPKPRSKETGILLLADSVEAASRLVDKGNTELLEATIARIVEDRRADGQLDECELTFKELQLVQQSFLRSLAALRHERIAYPDLANEEAEKAQSLDHERMGKAATHRKD